MDRKRVCVGGGGGAMGQLLLKLWRALILYSECVALIKLSFFFFKRTRTLGLKCLPEAIYSRVLNNF